MLAACECWRPPCTRTSSPTAFAMIQIDLHSNARGEQQQGTTSPRYITCSSSPSQWSSMHSSSFSHTEQVHHLPLSCHPQQHATCVSCPTMPLIAMRSHPCKHARISSSFCLFPMWCALLYRHCREEGGAGISRGMQEGLSRALGNVIFSEESSQDHKNMLCSGASNVAQHAVWSPAQGTSFSVR